jgi:hypothetical protein
MAAQNEWGHPKDARKMVRRNLGMKEEERKKIRFCSTDFVRAQKIP